MRMLVTGGCGFIGSNFIRDMLARHGDLTIVNLDALTDCPRDLTDPTVLVWADGATFADEHPKAWQAISDVLAERVKGEPPFAFVLCEPKGKGRRR